jgi:hypothetical protein
VLHLHDTAEVKGSETSWCRLCHRSQRNVPQTPLDLQWTRTGKHQQLQELNLEYTALDDTGLQEIGAFRHLRKLSIGLNKNVTDSGLRAIEELDQLQMLDLCDTPIGDSGVARLVRLHQLRNLNLANTCITDVGLKHIQNLRQLNLLHLEGTKVTAEGIANLREALPNTKILTPSGADK